MYALIYHREKLKVDHFYYIGANCILMFYSFTHLIQSSFSIVDNNFKCRLTTFDINSHSNGFNNRHTCTNCYQCLTVSFRYILFIADPTRRLSASFFQVFRGRNLTDTFSDQGAFHLYTDNVQATLVHKHRSFENRFYSQNIGHTELFILSSCNIYCANIRCVCFSMFSLFMMQRNVHRSSYSCLLQFWPWALERQVQKRAIRNIISLAYIKHLASNHTKTINNGCNKTYDKVLYLTCMIPHFSAYPE